MHPREKIVNDFAKWTAFSATRSGCPIKSGKDVYPLIEIIIKDTKKILTGNQRITPKEFNRWHEKITEKIHNASKKLSRELPIGWAAKLINVYLKTRVYVAGEGRKDLSKCIHPPIDRILFNGIKEEYPDNPEIRKKTKIFNGIGKIEKYEEYRKIIEFCRSIAKERGCKLIEVEEMWSPNATK